MDKETFSQQLKDNFVKNLKDNFEEALEEFSKQEVRIPHPFVKYECPECCSKEDFKLIEGDGLVFRCKKCKCEAKLLFHIIKSGEGY